MHQAKWTFGKTLCEEGLGLELRVSSTNKLNSLSLRGAERRGNPTKDEIATPFALDTMRCRAWGSQ